MKRWMKYIVTFCISLSLLLGNITPVMAANKTIILDGNFTTPSSGKWELELSVKDMPSNSTAIQVDILVDKAIHIEEISFPYGKLNNSYFYSKTTQTDTKKKISLFLVNPKQSVLPTSLSFAKIKVPSRDKELLKKIEIDQVKILDEELKEYNYTGKIVIKTQGSGSTNNSDDKEEDKEDKEEEKPTVKTETTYSSKRDIASVSLEVKTPVNSKGIAVAAITKDMLVQSSDIAIASKMNQTTMKTNVELLLKLPNSTTGYKADSMSITLDKVGMNYLASKKINTLTISSPVVSLTLDQKAIESIVSQAQDNITIGVAKSSSTNKTLIGTRPVFDLTILSNKREISNFKTGSVLISIPYTKAKGESASNLMITNLTGTKETPVTIVNSSYDSKKKTLTFNTNHFSKYAVSYKKLSAASDTKAHKSKEAIGFMTARELLTNKSKTKFSPDQAITRGEAAAALGKISGIHVKNYKNSTFKDVPSSNVHAPYIMWASKTGIIKGISKSNFSPNATITRQELAAILVKYAAYKKYDLPKVNKKLTYSDNSKISKTYAASVSKLQIAGIMTGTSTKRFEPVKKVTRGDFSETLKKYIESTLYIGELEQTK